MTRLALPLLLLAMVACQETPTSPDAALAPGASSRYIAPGGGTLPPPPPIDTGVVVASGAGSTTLNGTFFINRTGTNAFLAFKADQPDGTTASPDARIFYHHGVVSGHGTLSYQTQAGVVTVNLASVSSDSYFTSCEKGCFNLGFDDATLTTGEGTSPLQGGVHIAPQPAIDLTRG